jgi:hypothetical protein
VALFGHSTGAKPRFSPRRPAAHALVVRLNKRAIGFRAYIKKETKFKRKMSKNTIPKNVKNQVEEIVEKFNRRVIKNPASFYFTRYRGKYLYLSRSRYGSIDPICRLEYTGSMDGWKFAIYKYSANRYDPDEWMFPGAENIDGTVVGAMEAGLGAYPPNI